jgi:hypothetical protein
VPSFFGRAPRAGDLILVEHGSERRAAVPNTRKRLHHAFGQLGGWFRTREAHQLSQCGQRIGWIGALFEGFGEQLEESSGEVLAAGLPGKPSNLQELDCGNRRFVDGLEPQLLDLAPVFAFDRLGELGSDFDCLSHPRAPSPLSGREL